MNFKRRLSLFKLKELGGESGCSDCSRSYKVFDHYFGSGQFRGRCKNAYMAWQLIVCLIEVLDLGAFWNL